MLRFFTQQIAQAPNYHAATPSQPKAAWYRVDTSSNPNWRAKYVDYSLKDQNSVYPIFLKQSFFNMKHHRLRNFIFLKCNTFSAGVQAISDVPAVSPIKLAFRSILSNCLKTKQMIQNKMFIFTKWCHLDKMFISTDMIYHRHDTSLTKSLHKKHVTNAFHLDQGFPILLWPCTPSAFREVSMYPFSMLTGEHAPLS